MNIQDTVYNELTAQWDRYIGDYYRDAGITADSPADEKVAVLKSILAEVEHGMTITPTGEKVFLSDNAGRNATNFRSPREAQQIAEVSDRNQLLIKRIAPIAIAIVILIVLWIAKSGGLKFGGGEKATPEPTVVVQAPVDYSIDIKNSKQNFTSSYARPEALVIKGKNGVADVQVFVNDSVDELIKRGSMWCDFSKAAPNAACWLQGSVVNTIIGFRYEAFENYFSQAAAGDKLVVQFGQRSATYTIQNITEVNMTDTTIFRQNEPKLTIIFFGQRDKDGKLLNVPTRRMIVAIPDQDENVNNIKEVSGDKTANAVSYIGDNTPFQIGDVVASITERAFLVPNDDTYMKVVFYIRPINPEELDLLTLRIYELEAGMTYTPDEVIPDYAAGNLKVTFYTLKSNSTIDFTFTVNADGMEYAVSGQIVPPQPLEYVAIDAAQMSAEYQPLNKLMVVHVPYKMLADAQPELCGNCKLLVNGEAVLPTAPVYFQPSLTQVDISYSVNINLSNVNAIQMVIGNNNYSLEMQNETETPAPTATP